MTTLTNNLSAPAIQLRSMPVRAIQNIWACVVELRARRAQSTALRQLKDRDLQNIGLIGNDISAATPSAAQEEAAPLSQG